MTNEAFPLIERLHSFFKQKGLKLSVAESCTGGLISHYITSLPGASLFFEGGAITYSNELKKRLLGVHDQTLTKYGAVSEQTAIEMAEGIQRLTKTHCSISTTGNLGPQALEEKDVGLVYIAARIKNQTFTKTLRLNGDREKNKESAALRAIEFLMDILEESGGKQNG